MAIKQPQNVLPGMHSHKELPTNSLLSSSFVRRVLPQCAYFSLWILLLVTVVLVSNSTEASALQTSSANSSPNPVGTANPAALQSATMPPIRETLRPALEQVGVAARQVQSDRWKVSREAKNQLRSDLTSIQQDLSSQLPTLFQAAEADPAALGPQLSVMHNVDALYDVLVRVSTTANLTASNQDAVLLDNALVGLESARKTVANRLLLAASNRDQELVRLQTQAASEVKVKPVSGGQVKTIVVNNQASHRTKRHKVIPHKKPPATPPNTAPSNTTPGGSHDIGN